MYLVVLETPDMHHQLNAETYAMRYDFLYGHIWWVNCGCLGAAALAALAAGDGDLGACVLKPAPGDDKPDESR